MKKVYDNCCGIDVHKHLIVACFVHGRNPGSLVQPSRRFFCLPTSFYRKTARGAMKASVPIGCRSIVSQSHQNKQYGSKMPVRSGRLKIN